MSVPIFCPCLMGCLLLLSFESSLHILDTSLLSDIGFARIIYQSVALSFHSPDNVFQREEISFNEVQVINFFFYGLCSGVISEIFLLNPRSQRFSPKNCIALQFKMYILYFEWIRHVVWGVYSNSFSCLWISNCFSYIFWKGYSFSSALLLLLCKN